MCAPSDDICQLGYIHQKAPLQCLSKKATGFISNEQDHCDCPKTHCMPRGNGQPAHCVAGARTVPWELGCK
jgi:hypothetical protein